MAAPLRRVVVTGIGVVSPNGVGAAEFARACREGRSGVTRPRWNGLESPDIGELKVDVAGQVHG
ncbi:MAG: beta-ketoacyl synthase N-terminal-like domain-containing protein, partial [Planctomycetota bacterium]